VINASVLNTCIRLYDRAATAQRLMGCKYDWTRMAAAIATLKERYGHTLPQHPLRFRKRVALYRREGYISLISGKFGNQSARKVSQAVKRLIIGIACQKNQPYNKSVWEQYLMFVTGELDVYDIETGELFNPDDYTDKNGDPLSLSESTVNNILNEPKSKLIIEKAQRSRISFMHEQMPHVHRHGGQWSLSQITMDDVDLTRKLRDTKQRVHAYYAYDVVSQCVVGASYGRKKDETLVVNCFRDMFRLIDRNGWGIPAGIEVENHLMTQYKDGFLQAGIVFPFVHFCAPQNSQEKYAEQLNGAKKRSIIHKNHEGIGRFYGKGKWRTESKKISDADNDTWEDKEYYSWDELVADDLRDSYEWNHAPHPDQARFPGMTRWDVLTGRLNPSLQPLDKLRLSWYIGEHVDTSVRRNSTVTVAGEQWWLSAPEVIEKLRPNDYKVTACYLPDEDGKPTDVYLFQGERYIDKVERVVTYNRVMAEQTDEDVAAYIDQQKKIARTAKYVRSIDVPSVGVMSKEPARASDAVALEKEITPDVVLPPVVMETAAQTRNRAVSNI